MTSGLPAPQSAVYSGERAFWSGNTGNPADTGNAPYGIANYITERSVIGRFPFFSRFNAGTGNAFFASGRIANSSPWYSMGIQDILPSWQWWTKSFDDSSIPTNLLSIDYDYSTAFDGGTSLKISGLLSASNPTEIRLFKTNLSVPSSGNYKVDVVYRLNKLTNPNLYLGLIFSDTPQVTTWRKVEPRIGAVSDSSEAGWTRGSIALSEFAGRTIAAASLGVKLNDSREPAQNYTINIGEIGFYNEAARFIQLPAPQNFHIEKSQINSGTAELRLCWDFDHNVWYYDIYRLGTGGMPLWLGRITGDAYYVDSLPRIGSENSTEIELRAVAYDPSIKSSSKLIFPW